MTVQKIIPIPTEIAAAKAWFAENFDDQEVAGSFSAKGDKLSGLLSIPPVSQATLNAILLFAQTAIQTERKENP